ncbi:MAG: HPF/RaiA family ribosome-associated protein, partial [Pseudolabrys sp.]
MQTPVEIDFQGMSGTPEIHASIEKHVAELEQRYGRVTACRVVLKGPGGHHRTGGLYEVNIFHDFHCPAGVWLGCPVHQVSYYS